jgi:hypothetical protein
MGFHQSRMSMFKTSMAVHQWTVFRMVNVLEFATFGFFL